MRGDAGPAGSSGPAGLGVDHAPTVRLLRDWAPMVTAVDPAALLAGVRAGRPRAVGRLISLVESRSPLVPALVAALAPDTGRALVVGLTGAPGVGKSSAVGALVARLRARGRTRRRARGRPDVPLHRRRGPRRPRPHAGARARRRRAHPLDGDPRRAGRPGRRRARPPCACWTPRAARPPWSRRSGVGQSEVAVAATADVTLVLLAPGAGDGVQLAKAGRARGRRRPGRDQGRPGRRHGAGPRAAGDGGPRPPRARGLGAAGRRCCPASRAPGWTTCSRRSPASPSTSGARAASRNDGPGRARGEVEQLVLAQVRAQRAGRRRASWTGSRPRWPPAGSTRTRPPATCSPTAERARARPTAWQPGFGGPRPVELCAGP